MYRLHGSIGLQRFVYLLGLVLLQAHSTRQTPVAAQHCQVALGRQKEPAASRSVSQWTQTRPSSPRYQVDGVLHQAVQLSGLFDQIESRLEHLIIPGWAGLGWPISCRPVDFLYLTARLH